MHVDTVDELPDTITTKTNYITMRDDYYAQNLFFNLPDEHSAIVRIGKTKQIDGFGKPGNNANCSEVGYIATLCIGTMPGTYEEAN